MNVKIVLPIYESHTMPFKQFYHKSPKYYKVQIPELEGSNLKINYKVQTDIRNEIQLMQLQTPELIS
jgi:hypothetical protein